MFNFKSKIPNIDVKSGFYNRCFFDLRLNEERRRSERSGLPFSVLSMDIVEFANLAKHHSRRNLTHIKKEISDIVRKSCRISDIKTWYDDTTLKILLPKTSMTEAHVLCDKFNDKFNNGLCSSLGIKVKYDFKKDTMITCFPEVIKNSESFLGEKSKPLDKLANGSVLKLFGDEHVSISLTMKWDPLKPMSLTWPLYSDILNDANLSRATLWIKRGMDIMGALAGIIFFSPVMLAISVLIKCTSCGPILFRQERIGFLGKKFTFLKFRSMYVDCSEDKHREYVTKLIENCLETNEEELSCNPTFKMNKDPRITPFGRFLRKSSLDELPQLFNVLKGEMSLVGPRPPILYEVEKYDSWHFRRVLEVKPGITGLWQVEGRSSTTFDEMVRLDIKYVNNFSLWFDLKILFKTIWAVISAKGAY